jgi:hypothetical protein
MNCLEIGVPEGNRTPDPRFRKHAIAVLNGCGPVQKRSRTLMKINETATGQILNGEEPECIGVNGSEAAKL